MTSNISTEDKLKERIKELTCLYTVSSYIANSDLEDLDPTINAIAGSLLEAIQYPNDASVELNIENKLYKTGDKPVNKMFILSAIKVFNKVIGSIKIGYSKDHYTEKSFLDEERQLLDKIALEIGNLYERKQIVEQELLSRRQIERTDRLAILGEITAGIAHELNTPLANILGYSELLKEQIVDHKNAISDLDKIMNSAIYSREVVKKLMFFSCEMPQQMSVTNIVPIIEDAIGLLKPNFLKKKLRCELNISHDDIPLQVDAIQLTQVIFNLMINAIYFSFEGGLIKVDLTLVENDIHIEISDEGTGIDPIHKTNVFNPFFTTKPVGDGSGLGLSVVHGIVKSHRGSISYKTNVPKGTVFSICLPKK